MDANTQDNYEHEGLNVSYAAGNVPGRGCETELFEMAPRGCSCGGQCHEVTCQCQQGTGVYDVHGRLAIKDLSNHPPILECNSTCTCPISTCGNRVVQKGPLSHLIIRATTRKGFGLSTKNPIARGTFVCEYAGEIIGETEAKERQKIQDGRQTPNYILKIRERSRGPSQGSVITCIDPTAIGNIGRYINHACQPNLTLVPVRSDSMIPHIGMFALRDIPAGQELTFHYGQSDPGSPSTQLIASKSPAAPCFCLSSDCSGFLPNLS